MARPGPTNSTSTVKTPTKKASSTTSSSVIQKTRQSAMRARRERELHHAAELRRIAKAKAQEGQEGRSELEATRCAARARTEERKKSRALSTKKKKEKHHGHARLVEPDAHSTQ